MLYNVNLFQFKDSQILLLSILFNICQQFTEDGVESAVVLSSILNNISNLLFNQAISITIVDYSGSYLCLSIFTLMLFSKVNLLIIGVMRCLSLQSFFSLVLSNDGVELSSLSEDGSSWDGPDIEIKRVCLFNILLSPSHMAIRGCSWYIFKK